MSAFTIFGVCALFLSYADVTEAATACPTGTCDPSQFVNMYQLQVPAACEVPITKTNLAAYAKAASESTDDCDGTTAGTNTFALAQPLTSTNVGALKRFALGAVFNPVVGDLLPVLDVLYTENYGSFDATNADDVNAMTAVITALLEQLRPSYVTFTAVTTGIVSPASNEMTGLTTLMKAGLTTVKGCASVSRQDVNIWYAYPTVAPAGAAGVFWRTCETTQQTNNGVVEHHLDFSNMGIDVVQGLCHIVASFIADTDASTVKSTLHVNFDHNFIGQHGFLSGVAAFTSSPPSGQDGYTQAGTNEDLQFCGQIKSWLPSYLAYTGAPTIKLDRVFISCRDCKFDEFSSRENLIFPGTILPAIPGELASAAGAAAQALMLEASTLGGFDATDNDRMHTMTLASKDQAIAASDKNGKGGLKMANKAKVQLMLDAKRNIGEFPDVAKRLGLTDNSHGTAGVYGDADILSKYTTEYWVAMLGILIASIIGELGALRVCKM